MRQLQMFGEYCEPPALNGYVTDKQLLAAGWTRSVEEWRVRWGTRRVKKRRRRASA